LFTGIFVQLFFMSLVLVTLAAYWIQNDSAAWIQDDSAATAAERAIFSGLLLKYYRYGQFPT
jgi:hypothetical protein